MERLHYQCRICLSTGDIPIFDDKDDSDLLVNIRVFGNIEIDKCDDFPQYLCDTCLSLLKNCVLFRNTALKTDKLLKLRFKDDNLDDKVKETKQSTPVSKSMCTNEIYSKENNFYLQDFNGKNQIDCSETETEKNSLIMIIVSDEDKTEMDESTKNSQQESDEYNCSVCNMDFELLEDYKQHIKTKYHINTKRRANRVPCQICEKHVVASKYALHIEKHNSEELQKLIFECKKCDIQFNSIEDFENHNNDHHSDIRKGNEIAEEAYKLQCNICDKFVSLASYKTHLKLHGCEPVKDKTFRSCPYCNKIISYSHLKNHIERVHGTENNKIEHPKYVCDKCGKVFKTKNVLELHILTHGAELKYKCIFCPYKGLHQALLNIHVRTHTGHYNYKCTKCPSQFLTKSNLSKHLKRHRGPIDYKCSSCDKGFYSKLELDRHYDVQHLGSKNHICNICGKAFGYRNNMMCHQLKVHKRQRLTSGKGRIPSYLQAEQKNIFQNE